MNNMHLANPANKPADFREAVSELAVVLPPLDDRQRLPEQLAEVNGMDPQEILRGAIFDDAAVDHADLSAPRSATWAAGARQLTHSLPDRRKISDLCTAEGS